MTQSLDVTIPDTGFEAASPAVQRDPYPYYRWLLRNEPVHRGARGIWYVTRYADVRTVMSDPRYGRAGIRDFWAGLVGPGPLSEILRHTIMFQDDPDHGRLRAMIGPAFAPRRIRGLQRTIEKIVDDLIAPLARRGTMDVVNDVAYPLPLTVTAHLLGLPPADRALLRSWSLGIAPTLDLAAGPAEIVRGQQAMGEFVEYLRQALARRTRTGEPGADLLGVMLRATDGDDRRATVEEIISMAVTVVFAGHDTVTNLIGNGMLALLRHPGQLALLRQQPDLIPNAVEEFLRYDSPVQSNSRYLTEDVAIGGRTMRRGELAVALIGAANHDESVFAEPARFDVTRSNVQPMSFGAGMRLCVGALLARLEARAAFGRLVRLADLRLAIDDEDLIYQRSTMFRGVEELPVSFTPERGTAP
ncbi:cytochrome P450 [Micromonospora sp. NPDC126480]|uniref:cytochrome P450 n=1 Tax=Micromonospora sp. NPDC126480 TaxID=3155312 RepID=UPI00332ACE64